MKKIVVILLMVAYGVSSFGTTIHLHYCMNKLVEASVSKTSSCSDMGMMGGEGKSKCCKHEYKQVKVDNHNKNLSSNSVFKNIKVVGSPVCQFQVESITIFRQTLNTFYLKPDLPRRNNKIYIFNCVYRI